MTGGCGINSNCVTDVAWWRFDVPTQSEPVSPPTILNTLAESLRESLDTEILSGKSDLLNDEKVKEAYLSA